MIEVPLYDYLGCLVKKIKLPKHVDSIILGDDVYRQRCCLIMHEDDVQETKIYVYGTTYVVPDTSDSGIFKVIKASDG